MARKRLSFARPAVLFLGLSLAFPASPWAFTFAPTTSVSALTSNNTSASGSWTNDSSGDAVPGNVSTLPVSSLLTGNTKVIVETQSWFGGANHISVGYDSSSTAQVNKQFADMMNRGLSGIFTDWNGPNDTRATAAINAFKTNAEGSGGKFVFGVMIDKGAFNCSDTATCTNQAISNINYVLSHWAVSSAYPKDASGRPIIQFFLNSGTNPTPGGIDWTAVRSGISGNASLVFMDSAGFSFSFADGSFAWVNIDGNRGLSYLSNFYSTAKSTSKLVYGDVHKGFNDKLASWGTGRVIDQECGQTWLDTFSSANSNYLSSGHAMQAMMIDTWDDYEEGTEIETGIDNCLNDIQVSMNGSVASWTPSFGADPLNAGISGTEKTLHHYSVYISTQGSSQLMHLQDVNCGGGTCPRSLDLSTLGISGGPYNVYVYAVGQPSVKNHLSSTPAFYNPGGGGGTGAISGTVTNVSDGSALSGATVSYSGGSATTDALGNYTLSNAAVGVYTVTAAHVGYLTRSFTVSVTAGNTATQNFPLATAGKIAGSVKNSGGSAIGGAGVNLSGGVIATNLTLTTDASGNYNSSWVPVGSYTVAASAVGYVSQSQGGSVTAGNTTTLNFALDENPPTVTITSPADGAAVSGMVTVGGGASGTTAITSVQVSVDSGAFATASGTSNWTFGLNTSALSNGLHTATAQATDALGNTSRASISLNVGNPVPVITSSTTASGTVGTAFSYQIAATNGPTSFNAGGLPAGLSVNALNGLISGTPASAGTSSVTLSAANGAGTGTQLLTLTVSPAPPAAPVITSSTTASGTAGTAFSYQITATNGPTSFDATGLPAGLSVGAGTGLISGTPTASGIFNVTLSAANAGGTGTTSLALSVSPAPPAAPVITSVANAAGTVGDPFSYQITASNNPTSFNATGLPAGLSVNMSNGLISGTPSAAGTSTVALSAANAGGMGTAPLALKILTPPPAAPVITSPATASGAVGAAFSYQITATNSPTSFGATGLPAGLSVNVLNGSISGAPSAAGAFNVTLSATNAGGTATAQLSVIITAPAPGSAPGLKAAIAFPNPAVRADPTLRAFMGGVSSLTITIFNAHGRVVHSATISGSPTGTLNGQPYYDYVWSGDKASGVYFAVIHGKAADGTVVRARVKLAVVR